jgi:hypothetical protein
MRQINLRKTPFAELTFEAATGTVELPWRSWLVGENTNAGLTATITFPRRIQMARGRWRPEEKTVAVPVAPLVVLRVVEPVTVTLSGSGFSGTVFTDMWAARTFDNRYTPIVAMEPYAFYSGNWQVMNTGHTDLRFSAGLVLFDNPNPTLAFRLLPKGAGAAADWVTIPLETLPILNNNRRTVINTTPATISMMRGGTGYDLSTAPPANVKIAFLVEPGI